VDLKKRPKDSGNKVEEEHCAVYCEYSGDKGEYSVEQRFGQRG